MNFREINFKIIIFNNLIMEQIMKKLIIALLLSTFFLLRTYGAELPENLTLHTCLMYGIKNNTNVLKAGYDKANSEFKVSEALSNGLPQIEGFVQSIDNIKKTTTLLPGELMGKPGSNIALEMGTQYSTSAGVTINQLLYSQTYFLSITVSKKLNQVNNLNFEKVKEDVIYDITKMYALASITNRQIELINSNIDRLDSIILITKAQVDNGYAKSVDLDRANVSKSNLQIQLDNTVSLYKQQLDMIKYYIDIPSNIIITDTVKSLISNNISFDESDIVNRKEIQLLKLQNELYQDNLSAVKYEYYPTLSFFSQFQYQNMREDYKLFGTKWYGNAYIGLNLKVPIFDGLNKHYRVAQAEIASNKAGLELSDTKKYFATNYSKYVRDYNTNSSSLIRQEQNVELARSILNVSKTKLGEGTISMSDILTDESNLAEAESNYLGAKLQLIYSELEILKSVGKLETLLNN